MRFFFVVCCLLLSQQGYHRLDFFHNETEPLFLLLRASRIESICTRCEDGRRRISLSMETALAFKVAVETCNCKKLDPAAGSVFLKSSKASSSLRILMVSDSASSSSARVLQIWSHSCCLVPQLFSRSAWNFVSCSRASLVSVRSPFISTMLTETSPWRTLFSPMDAVSAATSLVFADISS